MLGCVFSPEAMAVNAKLKAAKKRVVRRCIMRLFECFEFRLQLLFHSLGNLRVFINDTLRLIAVDLHIVELVFWGRCFEFPIFIKAECGLQRCGRRVLF